MGWDEIDKEKGMVMKVEEVEVSGKKIALGDIEKWLLESSDASQNYVGLLYGLDSTGKSGFVLSYPLQPDEGMVVLDLDGGDLPIVKSFHAEKWKDHRIIVKDPTTVDINTNTIDYDETFNKILSTIEWVKQNCVQRKIKVFVLDGISTLLKYCEFKMRDLVKKNVSEGLDMRFWKIRSKYFIEVVTLAKSLPIDVFFIAHEDFIATEDKEIGSVRQRMNQMAFQKFRFTRIDSANTVNYYMQIDKSKYNPAIDGQQFSLLQINKEQKTFVWKANDIWTKIR